MLKKIKDLIFEAAELEMEARDKNNNNL